MEAIELTNFQRKVVKFSNGRTLEIYQISDGETYININDLENLTGYSSQVLLMFSKVKKKPRNLENLGFTGQIFLIKEHDKNDVSDFVKAIYLKDFSVLLRLAASKGRQTAIEFLSLVSEFGIQKYFEKTFLDQEALTLEPDVLINPASSEQADNQNINLIKDIEETMIEKEQLSKVENFTVKKSPAFKAFLASVLEREEVYRRLADS
jgi:hypothetical protein